MRWHSTRQKNTNKILHQIFDAWKFGFSLELCLTGFTVEHLLPLKEKVENPYHQTKKHKTPQINQQICEVLLLLFCVTEYPIKAHSHQSNSKNSNKYLKDQLCCSFTILILIYQSEIPTQRNTRFNI